MLGGITLVPKSGSYLELDNNGQKTYEIKDLNLGFMSNDIANSQGLEKLRIFIMMAGNKDDFNLIKKMVLGYIDNLLDSTQHTQKSATNEIKYFEYNKNTDAPIMELINKHLDNLSGSTPQTIISLKDEIKHFVNNEKGLDTSIINLINQYMNDLLSNPQQIPNDGNPHAHTDTNQIHYIEAHISKLEYQPPTMTDTETYLGELNHESRNGIGILTSSGDKLYIGNFKDGKFDGKGVLIDSNSIYMGKFKDNEFDGEGVFIYPDGSKYTGEFKIGKFDGIGSFNSHDNLYTGEFKNDLFHGQGILNYSHGEKYEGNFKDGNREGHGCSTWPDGTQYEGNFKNNNRDGQGKLEYPDGKKYEGNFKNGNRHGIGCLTWPDGTRYEGNFIDDKCSGTGKISYINGDIYEGEIEDGKPHIEGVMTYDNGDQYKGQFTNGKIDGYGTYNYDNGDTYIGWFKENKKSGVGAYKTKGEKYLQEYIYEENKPIALVPRPGILSDNKKVNSLLRKLIEKVLGKSSQKDISKYQTIQIKGKGNITLKISTDSMTLDEIGTTYDKLTNAENMYCLIKTQEDMYVLCDYKNGIALLPKDGFNDPITNKPLKIEIEPTLLTDPGLKSFLQEHFNHIITINIVYK